MQYHLFGVFIVIPMIILGTLIMVLKNYLMDILGIDHLLQHTNPASGVKKNREVHFSKSPLKSRVVGADEQPHFSYETR